MLSKRTLKITTIKAENYIKYSIKVITCICRNQIQNLKKRDYCIHLEKTKFNPNL